MAGAHAITLRETAFSNVRKIPDVTKARRGAELRVTFLPFALYSNFSKTS